MIKEFLEWVLGAAGVEIAHAGLLIGLLIAVYHYKHLLGWFGTLRSWGRVVTFAGLLIVVLVVIGVFPEVDIGALGKLVEALVSIGRMLMQ